MAGCEGGRLREALQEAGIEALFPVQVAVWNQVLGPGGRERDLCVCSPTGSGKTLSFALPIVQLLSTRVLRRLRALVVLPTRDLAVQVKSVFDILAPAVGLSVGLVGQSTVAAEASELVKSKSRMIHSFGSQVSSTNTPVFESCVDILVATPGRFMDHLKGTPGFTVEHLQYLVSIFFCTAR
jgi:ATP-dependent RNA helicase DDX51/DBP6